LRKGKIKEYLYTEKVSEWLKEHAWTCKRVTPLRGFDKFVGNEFGQPQAGPERSEG
jgi:hypothetical protein